MRRLRATHSKLICDRILQCVRRGAKPGFDLLPLAGETEAEAEVICRLGIFHIDADCEAYVCDASMAQRHVAVGDWPFVAPRGKT